MNSRQAFALVLVVCLGCTHAQERFQNDLNAHRCDDALNHIPDRDPLVRWQKNSQQAAGTVASYSYTGASYTAEVLWDITGGIVMFVGLCGPTLVAMNFSAGQGQPAMVCLPGKFNALGSPPLGRRAFDHTRDLRCPDLEGLSHAVRDVSSCYEASGDKISLKKAIDNLENLKQSNDFYACLPESEKTLVSQQIDHLKMKFAE